jgi:hypothetical protein
MPRASRSPDAPTEKVRGEVAVATVTGAAVDATAEGGSKTIAAMANRTTSR